MRFTEMHFIACSLAGISLALHLYCSSNFIPVEDMTVIGYGFYWIHVACNFFAQVCLLSIVLILCVEVVLTDGLARVTHISAIHFPHYIRNLMLAGLLFSLVRFIIPGPVEQFSKFYKLSVFMTFAGTVVIAVDTLLKSPPPNHAIPRTESVLGRPWQGHQLEDEITEALAEPSEVVPITSMQRSASSESNVKHFVPTKRHRTVMELLQTETSYLRSLNTILKVYKEPLEKAVVEEKPLLAPEDIKSVFGGIKDIADAHTLIHQEITDLIDDWRENCCVANVIKRHKDRLMSVYPPFVNYFDMGKQVLLKQQQSNPEFKEFLTAGFYNPESMKQSIDALLIRPVQRLPSLLLLITDLRKRTPEDMTDHQELDKAIGDLKHILSYVNEDKRKTEGKLKIFDIVYEVTGCPVEIVSSNRSYLSRVDVTTLTDGFYRQGERLALYLLTDVMEIAKWRTRSHGKSLLKHVDLLPLTNIITIMDIADVDDFTNMFAIRYTTSGRGLYENAAQHMVLSEERVSVLQLIDDRSFKFQWMNSLAAQVAEARNSSKKNEILTKTNPSDLLNYVKRNTKLYKRLKNKFKVE